MKRKLVCIATLVAVALLTGCGASENKGNSMTIRDFTNIFKVVCGFK